MNRTFIKITLFLFIFLGFGLSQSQAQTESKTYSEVVFNSDILSAKGKLSYDNLLKTNIFTLQGFGVAAKLHESTIALGDLLKEKGAEKALQSLVRNATPGGKVYGLLGLQVIKSAKFKPDFAVYKNLPPLPIKDKDGEIISSTGGCMAETTYLKHSEIVEKLENGNWATIFKLRLGIK